MQLTIDSEFKSIIPAQTAEECAALEASLLAEGCRDALVVWQGKNILIDGHHRYDICTRHNIPFKTVEREFASREDVIIWMVDNQLARRNVNAFNRSELALRKEAAIAEQARANQLSGLKQGDNVPVSLKSTKREKVDTRKEVAATANTSEDTVRKVKEVSAKAPEPVKQQARAGDISVNRAYELTKALQALPNEYHEQAAKLSGDNLEKVAILVRLYKSSGSPETNGTFDEIMDTGGFSCGNEMDKWCNFSQEMATQINEHLHSLERHHKREAMEAKRAAVLAGVQDAPPELYSVIYADPPWQYDNSGLHGSAASHYPTMATSDICTLLTDRKVSVTENAVLFLWATNPLLTDALQVIDAWGFNYKTNMVWVKDRSTYGLLGFYVAGQHELLLIATRGSFMPQDKPSSIITAAKNEHSVKPEKVYSIIEAMYPSQRYLELFARQVDTRQGWSYWGGELCQSQTQSA